MEGCNQVEKYSGIVKVLKFCWMFFDCWSVVTSVVKARLSSIIVYGSTSSKDDEFHTYVSKSINNLQTVTTEYRA